MQSSIVLEMPTDEPSRSHLGARAKRTPPPALPITGIPRMSTIEEEIFNCTEPEVPGRGSRCHLYFYSVCSTFASLLYFLAGTSFDDSTIGAFLPSSPLLALTAYMSLLLTFREGVRRIALSVEVEPAIILGMTEEEKLLPSIREEEEMRLSGSKLLLVQGLTLSAAVVLMHLPAHALNGLPLPIGLAGWITSTCLVSLVMWDTINRVSSAEQEEPPEGLTVVGGYITKI